MGFSRNCVKKKKKKKKKNHLDGGGGGDGGGNERGFCIEKEREKWWSTRAEGVSEGGRTSVLRY